jgi:hypothetical protein
MDLIIFVVISIVVLGLVYLAYKKLNLSKKAERAHTQDANAQAVYESTKNHPEENKTLTLQERLSLSWQFLRNIKQQVLEKFSKDDQAKMEQLGNLLLEYGMTYKHDPNMEVKQNIMQTKAISKDKQKDQSMSM